jgi:hypothetical protein
MTWNVPAIKLPKIVFAQGGAVRETEVVCVRNMDRKSINPATAKRVPMVTIREGTAVRMMITPFINPITTPNANVAAMPTIIGK